MRFLVRAGYIAALVLGIACAATAQPPKVDPPARVPDAGKKATPEKPPKPPPGTILKEAEIPIDLGTALRLAGAENPQLLLARERVSEATAVRQLAAAQFLPNLNVGGNYDLHHGVLQQSSGNILKVQRDALYYGLGANAVGAGTVNIPGLNYNLNVGEAWFRILITRQRVRTAEAEADAVRNDVLYRTASAYLELLRSDGRRAIAAKNREEAALVAQLTRTYAEAKEGRKSDADRAAVELRRRDAALTQAEADTLTTSARLAQMLSFDPSTRLKPIEGWVVPAPIVPDPVPLSELLAIALLQRPELASRRSEIQASLYELSLARILPFSPNVILGFSSGRFGGGGDLVSSPQGVVGTNGQRTTGPRLGNFDDRSDLDVAVFWTFRNLGVGNLAQVRVADSRVKQMRLRELETVNAIRGDVAEAHARVAGRFEQIDAAEKAVRSAEQAYDQDLLRIKGGQGLPLELMDSLRLLGQGRVDYLDAIVDYNLAQIRLWVALGRPPADRLARPVPAELVPPPAAKLAPPAPLPDPRPIDPVLPKADARP
jgi:outer membrane protein TolC